MNKPAFEMYRDPEVVLPELIGLGWSNTVHPILGGPRTDGRVGYEIGYIARGSIEWLTPDGLDEAGPGSILVDRPGEWHGGANAILHPCERYWLRFNFPPLGALPGLSPQAIETLRAGFDTIRARHFPASPEIRQGFERLIQQQRTRGRFAEDLSRAALHQILFQVVVDHERDAGAAPGKAVRRAIAHLDAHLDIDFSGPAVAAAVGLSAGYFYDLFQREVGLTPGQYHARRRVAAAKRRLIESDASITEIALALGYSSSQYFATTFKRIVGMTPVAYRRLRERG